MSSIPNQIKDYYIAYFDILGYKEFFKQQPEQIPELLNSIHNAINRTKNYINDANNSPIMNGIGEINIHSKIFSDNVLLCMEVSSAKLEQIRILAFLQIVADIQRGFVNDYGLFVRGGILKGKLSINDDYIFGQGLIDVVLLEESVQFPRIVINNELISCLQQIIFYSKEDFEKGSQIEKRKNLKESIKTEEHMFYSQLIFNVSLQKVFEKLASRLVIQWPDENWILCYLNKPISPDLLGESFKNNMMQIIKEASPFDYGYLQQPTQDFDLVIKIHMEKIINQLRKYGSGENTDTHKEAELREKILRKYIWVMAFHNHICDISGKQEYKIFTRCNCDIRFLKMTIEVLDNE